MTRYSVSGLKIDSLGEDTTVIADRSTYTAESFQAPNNQVYDVLGIARRPNVDPTLSVAAGTGALGDSIIPNRAGVATATSDSAARFPTLAYGRTRDRGNPTRDAVHLAFQQGPSTQDIIVYTPIQVIGLSSGDSVGAARQLASRPSEIVTTGLQGCSFVHPSIAADSTSVAVAFEIQGLSKAVALRFRDTNTFKAWQGYTYKWGRNDQTVGKSVWLPNLKYYTWPSLTQFPAVDAPELRVMPLGAIAWQDESGPASLLNRQRIYWYGRTNSSPIANGRFA
jgi:hypothetical protein